MIAMLPCALFAETTTLYRTGSNPSSLKTLEEMGSVDVKDLESVDRNLLDAVDAKAPRPYIKVGESDIHWFTLKREEAWYTFEEGTIIREDKVIESSPSPGIIVFVLVSACLIVALFQELLRTGTVLWKMTILFLICFLSYGHTLLDWTTVVLSWASLPIAYVLLWVWKYLYQRVCIISSMVWVWSFILSPLIRKNPGEHENA